MKTLIALLEAPLTMMGKHRATIGLLFAIAVLPALDLLDWEPEFMNTPLINSIRVVDFPETSIDKTQIRYAAAFAFLSILLISYLFVSLKSVDILTDKVTDLKVDFKNQLKQKDELLTEKNTLLERSQSRVRAVSNHFSEFSENFAKTMESDLTKLNSLPKHQLDTSTDEREFTRITFDEIVDSSFELCKGICNTLQAIAYVYTQKDCAVSIKYFSSHNDSVSPAARDGKSYKLRASTDQKYSERDRSYRYNSVFVEILDKQLTHRIFNDIDVAELNGEYSNNANEHRRDSYNSCLVVPISQKKQGLNKNDVLGFICIDSKEAQFEDDYFLQLNFVISTMISIYMENILAKLYAQELNIFENENTRKKESEPL